jgi:hypothetical protein
MIEATVTGRDNQVVSSQGSMVVHGSEQYVGLARHGSFGRAGEPQTVDIVTVDMAGQPAPEQQVEVEVFSYTWENRFIEEERRWEWEEERTLVYSQTVTTGSHAQAEIAFTPPAGGSYRVVARTEGGAQSSRFLWIAGDGYLSWRRTNNDRITLLADQTSGRVGETVNILIPSPFVQPHYALITIERGGVLSHEVRRMEGNSHIYKLRLTEEHIPNVFVSVVLFRPFTTLEGVRLPADYKVGILPVTVAPDPQTLHITLEPEGDGAQPGDTVRYNLRVTDDEGEPVVAELSLDLVDKAVLSLMPRTPDEILAAFYGKRALGVVTASGLAISADRAQWEEQEQDDEWDDREKGGGLSPTTTPAPAPSPTAAPQPPGAPEPIDSLGEGEDPAATVRENFADTAYWNGSIETDAEGRASVELTLPDNLTTWVMRGVGLTSDTRVGEGSVELVATKPLLIRPVVPRFFVVGDRVELAANVSNRTNAPLETDVGLTSRGLTVTTSLTQTVQIAAHSEQRVTWQVVVQDVETADLIFSAVSGPYHDASKPRLATGPEGTVPVYRYSAPETVGTGGVLSGYGARTEVIALPPGLDDRRGTMTLRLAPSLAASLRDSLGYLEHFPYECTEQTVSRFLPNILTLEALKRLGVDAPELEARLPALVEEGVDRLRQGQNLDGGWGWWQRGESNPFVSAYVVLGLLHAREAGFVVDNTMLNYGVRYLDATLEEGKANPDNPARLSNLQYANRQAWLVFVLAEARDSGLSLYGDIPAVLDDLYEHRDDLSIAGRALLAMAMQRMNEDDGRIETLLSDLNTAAIMRATGVHWEEGRGGRWSMSTDTRSTAIVLLAFVRLDPDNQLLPGVVRWLMVARRGDHWHTTQETAWALMSLTAWMEHTGELAPDYDYAAWLSWPDAGSEYRREMLVRDHMGTDNVSDVVVRRVAVADLLQSTQTWLTIGRSRGSGNLYYTTHLRAFLPVEEIEPLNRGIIVGRRYTLASCTEGPACPEIAEARTGDVIRVEVSVVAPNNLFYVVVEDPLPAGAEIIDETLETTKSSNTDRGPSHQHRRWWWWWRWYDRSEFSDHKAVLFADYLPRGAYVYQYEIRATQPGEFRVIPPTANEIYFPETYGRGAGQLFTIAP